jgi:mono/diheme cytochrome c family protein
MRMLLLWLFLGCEDKDDVWSPPGGGGDNGDDVNLPQDTAIDDTDDPSDTDDPLDTEDSDDNPLNGEELYTTHCTSCHGALGEGTGEGPGITQELHHSDADLLDIIINGRGPMPQINVTEEEGMAIIDYMRATF